MPNWVYNTLTIEADKETIDKIKSQLNQPFSKQIDSMTKNGWERTTITYNNPVMAFWNIVKPTDLETYAGQPPFTKPNADKVSESANPLEEMVNMFNNNNDWYSFNNREWGTKWDIALSDDASDYEREQMLTVESDTTIIYRFDTAWSPPMNAIERLSLQYPDATFTLEYEEEQGWGGTMEIIDGSCNQIEEYDIPSSHAEMIERRGECFCSPPEFPFEDCMVKKETA